MDYNKMKVNDLKLELSARNLDTKGVKAILVERLKEAIEKENNGNAPSTPTITASLKQDIATPNPSTPVRRSRRRSMTRSPSPTKHEVTILESVEEEPRQPEQVELSSARKKRRTRSITKSPSPLKHQDVTRLDVLQEEPDTVDRETEAACPQNDEPASSITGQNEASTEISNRVGDDSKVSEEISDTTEGSSEIVCPQNVASTAPERCEDDIVSVKPTDEECTSDLLVQEPDITENKTELNDPQKPDNEESCQKNTISEIAGNESDEVVTIEPNPSGSMPKPTPGTSEEESDKNVEKKEHTTSEHEETSPTEISPKKQELPQNIRTKHRQAPIVFRTEENEPEIKNSGVFLSWFDSDLNLEIDSESLDTAKPLSDGALSLVWAGGRANKGVDSGKVHYEVLLNKSSEAGKVIDEQITCEFRVGWSVLDANLQLGEDKHSFGYANNGFKVTDCCFNEYGLEYKVNDVIGVYLDMNSSPCKIEYTVNNVSQGTAFEFDKTELEGKALFPHVYSKNIAFKINFGQLEKSLLNDRLISKNKLQPIEEQQPKTTDNDDKNKDETQLSEMNVDESASKEQKANNPPDEIQQPECASDVSQSVEHKDEKEITEESTEDVEKEEVKPIYPDYEYIGKLTEEELIIGISGPNQRKDCEVIFLLGLPSCGKTTWVENYIKENPDKKFTILNVEFLLDRMKISGVPRKPTTANENSKLLDQLNKSIIKLNDIAAKRRRNYIFDQTNVFASEQRRRLCGFGEYALRRAVVIVPDEEEYNRRIQSKKDKLGFEIYEGNINAMKAYFHIPTLEENWFTEFVYPELDEEKAREAIKKMSVRKFQPRVTKKSHQQVPRGANNQRWNQNYGNNRYGNQQYGYNNQPHRSNSVQQYGHNSNYRGGNVYGRRDFSAYRSGYSGNNNWNRNDGHRYNNRGYQNNQNTRFHGGHNNYGGYNSGSHRNQQNCWSYNSQNNDTQQWYSWWQSNLENLLQQHGGSGSDNSGQQANMEQYWSQYAQQHNYNYQSKPHGSGSSRNK